MKQKDDRTLTIISTALAHIGAGNLEFAGQVLQAEVVAIELRQKAEWIRDREQHGDVRIGHPHQHCDVSQPHCHREGRAVTKMLPMVITGDPYVDYSLLDLDTIEAILQVCEVPLDDMQDLLEGRLE